jgi:hypothetical protein
MTIQDLPKDARRACGQGPIVPGPTGVRANGTIAVGGGWAMTSPSDRTCMLMYSMAGALIALSWVYIPA